MSIRPIIANWRIVIGVHVALLRHSIGGKHKPVGPMPNIIFDLVVRASDCSYCIVVTVVQWVSVEVGVLDQTAVGVVEVNTEPPKVNRGNATNPTVVRV